MNKTVRTLHFLGLALFLGSIFMFIVVSTLTQNAGLAALAFGRQIIAAGTSALTLPGLALVAATGAFMSRRYRARPAWLGFKQLAMAAMALNTIFVILPAARDCRALAEASLRAGALDPAYHAAYLRESIAGGVNVLLALASMVAAVTRLRLRPQAA
jgi:hypothetical protein